MSNGRCYNFRALCCTLCKKWMHIWRSCPSLRPHVLSPKILNEFRPNLVYTPELNFPNDWNSALYLSSTTTLNSSGILSILSITTHRTKVLTWHKTYIYIYIIKAPIPVAARSRHVLSLTVQTLGSRVRISLGAWMCVRFFFVLCCPV
jgi:hypothetical protein